MKKLSLPQIQCLRHLGGDESVVQAMLVSTQGEQSQEAKATYGRINYLMRNRHGSPFEHNLFTFFVKAPLAVFRQFHRHRIWSYNEVSGRYSELPDEYYFPAEDRALVQTGKTGEYSFVQGTDEQKQLVQDQFFLAYDAAEKAYRIMLDAGIAPEVARFVSPIGLYSQMYATCNARALMSFLSLRTKDLDARYLSYPMWEIEQVARGMEEFFQGAMPLTHRAFVENGRVAP